MHNQPALKIFKHDLFTVELIHPQASLIKLTLPLNWFASQPCENTLILLNRIALALRDYCVSNTYVFSEVVPAFESILIEWDDKFSLDMIQRIIADVINAYTQLNTTSQSAQQTKSIYTIAVCYDDVFALDKIAIETTLQLPFNDIIRMHTQHAFFVQAVGFIPGFSYIGDLPSSICIPRQSTPRICVPKGSVAIAENKTAIYPNDCPGGWNIIGKAAPIFTKHIFTEKNISHPLLTVGQKIQFRQVDKNEFDLIMKSHSCG